MKWFKLIAVVGAVIIGGSFALLFGLSRLPNADRLYTSTEINAPRAKVWAMIDDEDKMKQWVSWLVEAKQSSPRGVGATGAWVMRDENNGGQQMRIETRCTEYVPESRLTVAMNSAPQFDGTQSYLLTDLGNGRTKLEISGRYHFAGWYANLMTPLILPAAKSKLEGDLARLKSLAEKS